MSAERLGMRNGASMPGSSRRATRRSGSLARLKLPRAAPFRELMNGISGTTAAYQIAVAGKVLDSNREQGQRAVALIQSAEVKPAAHGSVGCLLDVKA